jgi:hypothetical protein
MARPPSRLETRADATTLAARAIIQTEKRKQDAKTARLREARLAMEAGILPPVVAVKPKSPARKAAVKRQASQK